MQAEILYGVIGFMASLIVILIGALWHNQSGATKRIFELLDQIRTDVNDTKVSLHGELAKLDRRVTKLEARAEFGNRNK